MINRLLKQEEIDALLNAPPAQPLLDEPDGAPPGETSGFEPAVEALGEIAAPALPVGQAQMNVLEACEIDALGEVANICMGSAATTLSMLLNQKVSITSPRVTVITLEELFKGFDTPHMTIYVSFTEGLSGYNLLITKLQDAAVLADLMMGGDGTAISQELNEISESAASEAMNQMIGSASTAMATMLNRTVNISPPQTRIYYSSDEIKPPELGHQGTVVVVWFKMTIGSILDTQIMQVMSVETAREQAGHILGQFATPEGPEEPPFLPEDGPAALPDYSFRTGEEDSSGGFAAPDDWLAPAEHSQPDLGAPPAMDDLLGGVFKKAPVCPEPPPEKKTVAAGMGHFDQRRMDMILDIPLKVTVLLGRTRWPIKDILSVSPGSVVELQTLVDEPVEVLVNGTLVARGEVVVVNENFGVRITSIIDPEERLRNLGK